MRSTGLRRSGRPGSGLERDRAAIRFDFAESAAFDMESYVLGLRAGLGHLAGNWHAFDVAFSVYWERAHPGEPLDEFLTKDSALRRAARTIDPSEQIASTHRCVRRGHSRRGTGRTHG